LSQLVGFGVRYSDYKNWEDDSMYTYSCGTPAYQTTACSNSSGFGGGFAFILVLFILLAIICSTSFVGGGFGGCCEEREPRCFG